MLYAQSMPELRGMRVCKYIRCSHEDQVRDGDTLEAQNLILDDFIEKNHLILVDTFVDEALTARKKYTKRKEFVRLLDGVQRHDFDLIIFTKLDRWFRNIGDYYKIQEILDANGVQWKAVTEHYDTSTTNGRLHVNIRLSVAQDECDRDSDRIKDVFRYKLQNRTYISGNLPRGLKLDSEKHIVIDEDWKQYVLDMFDYFEKTNSKHATLGYIKKKYDLPNLCYDTIIRGLKQKLYKGEYKGDVNFCPALIDPERFDRIQLLARRAVRNTKKNDYIFNGLLRCSECNHNLTGNCVHHKIATGQMREYKTYKCSNHYNNKSCDRKGSLREEVLEELVLAQVSDSLNNYIAQYEVGAATEQKKDPQAEASRIRKKMKKLYELFIDDLIDRDLYKSEYAQLQSELNALSSVTTVNPSKKIDTLKSVLNSDWQEFYSTCSIPEKSAFWKSFVDHIVVYKDNSVDIVFL